MKRSGWLYAGLAALYLLHNDVWWWQEPRILLGLPAGLLYHLLFCLATAVWMALLVRHAWPSLEVPVGDDEAPGEGR